MKTGNFLAGYKEGFLLFGKTLSNLIHIILLSLIYFIGVGLTSIICRLRGKKFLELKQDKNKISYWEDKEIDEKNIHRMF